MNCHEINLSLFAKNKKDINDEKTNNIEEIKKEKIWNGKTIKCMHDLSKTGLAGDEKKVNQDNYFIFKNFVNGFENIYMGVCDGHGYYGHEVSGFIKENLPMDLNHALKKKKLNLLTDDLSETIKKCFIEENKKLLNNNQIDSDLSGTTCISVIYTPKKLIIANIGDSRCVLGKYDISKNIFISENLSRDHKPTIPEEAERILTIGGRIHPMRDEDGEFIGPLRVYMKDKEMPGLAMTRSFGDYFGSTAGIISEPEVTEYIFKEEDRFIIIASDGLFEFIESEKVVEIVGEYYKKNDIVGCCEYLYKESCKKWLDEEEDTIDDITIILVFFEDKFL
jgi:serine/threonine protein phosphatase PrpC